MNDRESEAQVTACPRCGGLSPVVPWREMTGEAFYCTPMRCDAWSFTERLTKQGPKPIRADGRADLRVPHYRP